MDNDLTNNKDLALLATVHPIEDLEKEGFDRTVYDYKAKVYIPNFGWSEQIAYVVKEFGFIVSHDGKNVIIFRLDKQLYGFKLEKILEK